MTMPMSTGSNSSSSFKRIRRNRCIIMALPKAGILLRVFATLSLIKSPYYVSALEDCKEDESFVPCQGKRCTELKQNLTKCQNNSTRELANVTFSLNETQSAAYDFNTTATLQNNITLEVLNATIPPGTLYSNETVADNDKCQDHPSAPNCLDVLQKSPKYCAIPTVHQMCCQSCQQIISAFPVQNKCKSNASSSTCPKILSGKPQLCFENAVRLMCCHICESILAGFEGSIDLANVTESIKRTDLNSTIICQDDTKYHKSCHFVTLYPHYCSEPDLQQKCCKACETQKLPETDKCETSAQCPRIVSMSPWFCESPEIQNVCCKSCENVISSLPALDLMGKCPVKPDSENCLRLLKREPTLCTEDTKVQKECCRICEGIRRLFKARRRIRKTAYNVKLLTDNDTISDINCPDHKDAPNCLIELSQSPKHCAHPVIQKMCCQTCKSLISNFPVLNFGDRCQNESDSLNCLQFIKRYPSSCSNTQVHKKCCNMCESISAGFAAPKNMTNIISTWQNNDTTDACQNDSDEPNCVNVLSLSPQYCAHPDVYRMCCHTCDNEISKFSVIDMTGNCHNDQESRNCVRFIRSNPHYCSDPEAHELCCRTCESILAANRNITEIETVLQSNETVADSCPGESDSSYCQELISLTPTYCENHDIQRTCCNTCESIISSLPVLNVTSQCQNKTDIGSCHQLIHRHPQYCSNAETFELCCWACENIYEGLAGLTSRIDEKAISGQNVTLAAYANGHNETTPDPKNKTTPASANGHDETTADPKNMTTPENSTDNTTTLQHDETITTYTNGHNETIPDPRNKTTPASANVHDETIADPKNKTTPENSTYKTAILQHDETITTYSIVTTATTFQAKLTTTEYKFSEETCQDDPEAPNCLKVLTDSPKYCAVPRIHQMCCQSCLSVISNLPEYGDCGYVGADDCQSVLRGNPHHCYKPVVRLLCCPICESIMAAFENARDLPNVTALVRSTNPTLTVPCRDAADNSACHILLVLPRHCQDPSIQQKCCKTCKDVASGVKDTCKEDPALSNVCEYITPATAIYCLSPAVHKPCCPKCEKIISGFSEIDSSDVCPDRDNKDTDCPTILRRFPHYCGISGIRQICCHTCVKHDAGFKASRNHIETDTAS